MRALYSVAQLRVIEQSAADKRDAGALMRRAGLAAADAARALSAGKPCSAILVLVGPGNNGGDALEAAANLAHAGACVSVLLVGTGKPSADAARALASARASAATFVPWPLPLIDWDVVIDGLFGIGLARPLTGLARDVVQMSNALTCPILALDVPSGLDADSGAVVGPDGVAVRATHTLTFIGDKPGLHTGDGAELCGTVQVEQLGIDAALYPAPAARLNGLELFAQRLTARRANTHKGSFGSVAVLGGARGMFGAAILAARAALYGGAGRVFVASLDAGPAYDPMHPELMLRSAHEFDLESATLVVGPGLGRSDQALQLLGAALACPSALLLDADALNLIAAHTSMQQKLAHRSGASVLTPHPLEAARLLGIPVAQIQSDRSGAARAIARQLNANVILKGAGSIIATSDGTIAINPTGNPGLATGGTGDVLAGLCGALLAQHWPAPEAALGAAWLHGAAADRLVGEGVGPIGMSAGELPAAIRALLNTLT